MCRCLLKRFLSHCLSCFQNKLTSALTNHNEYPHKKQRHKDRDEVDDIPQSVWSELDLSGHLDGDRSVQVLLLCGADLLESFAKPKLWNDDDVSESYQLFTCINCKLLL